MLWVSRIFNAYLLNQCRHNHEKHSGTSYFTLLRELPLCNWRIHVLNLTFLFLYSPQILFWYVILETVFPLKNCFMLPIIEYYSSHWKHVLENGSILSVFRHDPAWFSIQQAKINWSSRRLLAGIILSATARQAAPLGSDASIWRDPVSQSCFIWWQEIFHSTLHSYMMVCQIIPAGTVVNIVCANGRIQGGGRYLWWAFLRHQIQQLF